MNLPFSLLGVFLASLLGLFLGYLWYSVLFAKAWERLAGVTKKQQETGIPQRVISSYVLSLVMAVFLGAFIGPDMTPMFGLFAGLAAGFGWVAMAFGNNYLFEHRQFKLWLINAGYNTVLLGLMGLVIGYF